MPRRSQPPLAIDRLPMLLEPGRSPTMADVGRLAGTSVTTVSNVIQGHIYVRPETRQRVLSAIQTLGYHVNVTARALAQQKTNVLGIVLGNLENPSYASFAASVERHAYAHGYAALIVSTGGELETEVLRIQTLIEHRVAAIIFFTFSGNTAVVRAIPKQTPMVFVTVQGPGGASITLDDRLGAQLAVSHLLELGHRRIAYVSATLGAEPATDQERFAGYRQALAAVGIPIPDEHFILRFSHSPQVRGGLQSSIDKLLRLKPRPTAIFASSDFTAIEVIERADLLGLRIPQDLSIVGFDDINIASLARISLTTVVQPTSELASLAVDAAIALASGHSKGVRPRVLLEPKLAVRSTTGPPPAVS
jgi:LacI family transcriptional regulator